MNETKILNKVRTLLGMEVALESMKLEDGVTIIEAEVFEAGEPVAIITEDEQKIPLPVGEYTLEDGRMLIVTEEGSISEIKEEEAKEEEPKKEEEATPEVEEEVEASEDEVKPVKKTVESVVKETFFSEIEALVNENKELKAEIELLSKEEPKVEATEEVELSEEIELSEAPATEPIVPNPESKEVITEGFKYGNSNKTLNNIFSQYNK